jgi:Protein of unknown function (DUF2865)
MPLRSPLLAALLIGLAGSGAAVGQTAECQRYKAELASLGRSSNSGAVAQQRQEIARLSGYYHSIGCGGGQFFLFGGPPRECGAIAQRIATMQAGLARLAGAAEASGESRRRQLAAAVQQACNPAREASRQDDDDDERPRRLGGGRLVCVRACDGSFFPLHNLPESRRSDADDMCRALCPNAETAAYSMPSGADADIAQAVSLRGKRYTKLAAAFKYQKSFDPSCSCRKEGQSWAEALQKAEKMIERGRDDIIVTAKTAEELSRPKLARRAKPGGKAADAQVAASARDVDTTGSIGAAKPDQETAAGTSASSPERSEGKGETPGGPDAAKRPVRIVGPTFISLPQQTAE